MKKTLVLNFILSVLLITNCFGQKNENEGVHFGIKAGINVANVTIKSSGLTISPSSIIGGTGGFFATIPAAAGLAIQPELSYSMLGFKLTSGSTSVTDNINYLAIPVLAKYSFEKSGFAAYLGPQIGILLSAKEKSGSISNDIKNEIKSSDFAGVIGVEYTLPTGLNLSARYQLGLSNIAKQTQSGESLKNNALTFTVGYRFQ